MKNLLKLSLFLALSSSFLYALSPFSLEGVKSVNVRVLNKNKLVSKDTIKKIEEKTIVSLKKMGIKTITDEFSNFLIKIQVEEINKQFAVNVSLMLVESINPTRDTELTNIAITYQKSDFFIADDLNSEVYESAVEFLLPLFEEQYIAENSE